jgi:hypothetical protein
MKKDLENCPYFHQYLEKSKIWNFPDFQSYAFAAGLIKKGLPSKKIIVSGLDEASFRKVKMAMESLKVRL